MTSESDCSIFVAHNTKETTMNCNNKKICKHIADSGYCINNCPHFSSDNVPIKVSKDFKLQFTHFNNATFEYEIVDIVDFDISYSDKTITFQG